jgi:hypothetical protein
MPRNRPAAAGFGLQDAGRRGASKSTRGASADMRVGTNLRCWHLQREPEVDERRATNAPYNLRLLVHDHRIAGIAADVFGAR